MFSLLTISEDKGIDLSKFEKLYNQYKNLIFRVSFDILELYKKGILQRRDLFTI